MKNKLMLKTVLIAASIVIMADTIVFPILPNLFLAFPDANQFLQNYLISGTYLVAIPASLISARLAQIISKKHLMVFAFVVFIIGGIGLANTDNLALFVVFRSMMGITYGIVGTTGISLIATLFEDQRERGAMIGRFFAVMALSGIGYAAGAGYLALINWKYAFYLSLVAAPILVLIIFVIPETPPEGRVSDGEKSKTGPGSFPYMRSATIASSALVFNILYGIMFVFIAVYLQEQSLGNSSDAGIMSSLMTFGSFVSGTFFSFFYARFRRFTPVLVYMLTAGSYYVLSRDVTLLFVGVCCLVGGWCYGLMLSYFMIKATDVPERFCTISAAVVNCSIQLGLYLSPYSMNFYRNFLGLQTARGVCGYVAITLGVCTVFSIISFLINLGAKKKCRKTEMLSCSQ